MEDLAEAAALVDDQEYIPNNSEQSEESEEEISDKEQKTSKKNFSKKVKVSKNSYLFTFTDN